MEAEESEEEFEEEEELKRPHALDTARIYEQGFE